MKLNNVLLFIILIMTGINTANAILVEKENLIHSGDSVFWSAYFSKNLPNTLKVISHANVSLVNRSNGKEFAIYLEENEYVRNQIKRNKPIVIELLACSSGADMKSGIAVTLSRELNALILRKYGRNIEVYVLAPNKLLWSMLALCF